MRVVELQAIPMEVIKSSFVARAFVRFVLGALLLSLQVAADAQTPERATTFAVLDFGSSAVGRFTSQRLTANLKQETGLIAVDRDQALAAARGAGYAGSLNLSLDEARNLGAVLGCDFFILGDAQTLRRSPSTGSSYFEAYATMFL